MTYGPPPEPNAYSAPPHPHQQQQQTGHPPQPWTDPHGRTWPGGPPPAAPPKGSGLAVTAVILGLLGCVVPLLPINLDTIRAYSAFPFALPGLLLAILACIGPRRGKPLAVVAWILSALSLTIGLIMFVPTLL